MNPQSFSTCKEATLNVGCLGQFAIRVYGDGYWEVRLDHKDGSTYHRTRGTMIQKAQMLNHCDMQRIQLPEWMWECVEDKIGELTIMLERNALDTPEVKNAVV